MRRITARPSIGALTSSAVIFFGALAGTPAYAAWEFEPTAAEWASWSDYCRAQYSWVNAGFTFQYQYGGTVPAAIVDHWRQVIGDSTFYGMHHWCASIHFLNRARSEADPKVHDFLLSRANEDATYSFDRTDPKSFVYPDMAVTVAQIRDAKGKPDQAEAILRKGMLAQPKRSEPYVMLAMLKRKQHKLSEARDVLKQADEVTAGESPEVQYNLGLINLELGDTAAARANARKAYQLGYPLPGLKNLLRKKGQWGAEDDAAVAAPGSSTAVARADVASAAEPRARVDEARDDSAVPVDEKR